MILRHITQTNELEYGSQHECFALSPSASCRARTCVDEISLLGPGKKPLLVLKRIPCTMALKVSSVTRIQLPHYRLMHRLP